MTSILVTQMISRMPSLYTNLTRFRWRSSFDRTIWCQVCLASIRSKQMENLKGSTVMIKLSVISRVLDLKVALDPTSQVSCLLYLMLKRVFHRKEQWRLAPYKDSLLFLTNFLTQPARHKTWAANQRDSKFNLIRSRRITLKVRCAQQSNCSWVTIRDRRNASLTKSRDRRSSET